MFPAPIRKASVPWQLAYRTLLPVSLFLWLLPLMAVAVFSIKPADDFTTGNYWGPPSTFEAAANYGRVFFESDMPRYLLNSLLITVPTVIGAVALSCMTGFALGVYRFRANLWLFFMFVAGNFVPFQILMVPVRDLTLELGLYNTKTGLVLFHIAFQTGFCTLFMRNFIRTLPFALIESARVEGVSEFRIFRYVVLPLMKPAIAALSILIFTFIWNDYFWAVVLTQGAGSQPVTAGITSFQRAVPGRLPSDERRLHRCRPPPGGHVLPDAAPLHCRPDARRREVVRTWRLDDGRQTLVLAACGRRLPEAVYWGPPLPAGTDCAALARAGRIDVTAGMLDENPNLSICPEAARSFPGQPGLVVRGDGGELLLPSLRFVREEWNEDGGRLTLVFTAASAGLTYTARFATDRATGVMTVQASLEAQRPVHLTWLSAPVLPAPSLADEMIDFSGRWCGELRANVTRWAPGMRFRENRTGRSGHEHFPGLMLPCRGATNTGGVAYGFHYGWSGGHRMVAEELPDGRRQIQFGHAADTEAGASTHFETAPLYVVRSEGGLNGCAVAFQRHVRDRIVKLPRPGRPPGALQLLGGGVLRP